MLFASSRSKSQGWINYFLKIRSCKLDQQSTRTAICHFIHWNLKRNDRFADFHSRIVHFKTHSRAWFSSRRIISPWPGTLGLLSIHLPERFSWMIITIYIMYNVRYIFEHPLQINKIWIPYPCSKYIESQQKKCYIVEECFHRNFLLCSLIPKIVSFHDMCVCIDKDLKRWFV